MDTFLIFIIVIIAFGILCLLLAMSGNVTPYDYNYTKQDKYKGFANKCKRNFIITIAEKEEYAEQRHK